MGCCFGTDSLPPVPDQNQPDPPTNMPMQVCVHRMGQYGRDWAVYNGTVYPSKSDDRKQKMWLWFNKSDGSIPNTGVIDLENFVRGQIPSNPNKGGVLYTAIITERPTFEQFQRIAGRSNDFFSGFGHTNPTVYEDWFYLNHQRHVSQRQMNAQVLDPQMITKWRVTTKAAIRDGNLGRAERSFMGQEVSLFVHATGTVATTWERRINTVEVRDDQDNVTGNQQQVEIIKIETEFIDRVDFQLVFANQLWANWTVPGDSQPGQEGNEILISTPFFDCVRKGGWFSSEEFTITAKPPADPAFCVMLAFLCGTEYSLAEIKKDLTPNTPSEPPNNPMHNWGVQPGMNLNHQPCNLSGQYQMSMY